MSDSAGGVLLCILAGVTSGSFALPMKFVRGWAWENIWFAWTTLAVLLCPSALSFFTLPHIGHVYADMGFGLVLLVAMFGIGWGVAQVLFGLAVDSIGMALPFSIAAGMSAAIGSVVPLLRVNSAEVLSARGVTILTGVFLIGLGLTVCGVAGAKRETTRLARGMKSHSRYRLGVALAVGSGMGSAMINFGLVFGAPIITAARQHGASSLWASNSVWLPLMLAGAVPNLAYCFYLMRKNRRVRDLVKTRPAVNWLLAATMALFWFGSISIYGIASNKLGSWGTTLGWPLFTSLIVITADVLGIAAGEWKHAANPFWIQTAGISVLVLAVFVLSGAIQLV